MASHLQGEFTPGVNLGDRTTLGVKGGVMVDPSGSFYRSPMIEMMHFGVLFAPTISIASSLVAGMLF